MIAGLKVVEIPGYADALRREDRIRREAWYDTPRTIAGFPVRQITVRDMVALEEMRNGFFCPWRFDSDQEILAHCAHLVWWLSDCKKATRGESRIGFIIAEAHRVRLMRIVGGQPRKLVDDVMVYLKDTFADAPRGGSGFSGARPAGAPATYYDILAAGGYSLTLEQLYDLPLVRLWQMLRLIQTRLTGHAPASESDKLACDYLGTLNKGGQN